MAELIYKGMLKNCYSGDFRMDGKTPCMATYESIRKMIDIQPTTTEAEIRAKAVDEFAEVLKERLKGMQMVELQGEDVCPCAKTGEECPYMNQDIGCQYCAREQTIRDIDEIAEQLKGGAE